MSKDKSKMKNSKYTREFRDSSVQLVLNSQESTAKIANDTSINAKKIREFLVSLSGRLIQKDKEFTHPALLAGLENYIQMLDLMSMFTRKELLDMKQELVKIMGMDI